MIIYFDTETTGLYPGQIAQISYVMQSADSLLCKNFFFTVDAVEYGAFKVHGFTVEKLRELSCGQRFCDHVDEIEKDFNDADLIVAHNTAFDFMFMRTEFERLDKVFYCKKELCTMKGLTPVCKIKRSSGGYKYPKLAEACEFFGITDTEIKQDVERLFGASVDYHDARFDTVALYLVANRWLNRDDCPVGLGEGL